MRALNGVLGEGFYEIKGAGGLENRTGLSVFVTRFAANEKDTVVVSAAL